MMSVLANSGSPNLSPTYKSSHVFTPNQLERLTISDENFKRYFDSAPKVPKTPWGRSLSYGGLGRINLPDGQRSKWEPPLRVEKGHLHYGAGVMPHASEMKIKQFYSLTPLNKSKVRSNDQLIPSANQENIGNFIVNRKFPAEHPYSSHSSRFALFPSYDTPTDGYKGEGLHLYQPTLPPATPAAAPDASIVGKSRGSPARHERIQVSRSSERNPLRWIDGPNFFQLPKGPEKERQKYYPSPPSTVRPASGEVLDSTAVTPRTASRLNDIEKSMWVSTYRKDFVGRSEFEPNPVLLRSTGMESVDEMADSYRSTPIPPEREASYANDVNSTPNTSRRSSYKTNYEDAETNENGARKLSQPNTAATPKSVQFRRSVTFSDGKSLREIPLHGGESRNESRAEKNLPEYPKTPYPGHPVSNMSDPGLSPVTSWKETTPSAVNISKSVNNMPSQMKDAGIAIDPACPPKFFRPHTVGSYRSSTELLKVRDNWSKSATSRRFHNEYPEDTPDLRRKPDLRFTTNEKRHVIPEAKAHTYLFRGSDHM